MDDKYISVTNEIFKVLHDRKITQKMLSDQTGISTSAISDWKHKGSIPSVENVQRVCEALNISMQSLVNETTQDYHTNMVDFDVELDEFIALYSNTEEVTRKRILAYAKAMLEAEGAEAGK